MAARSIRIRLSDIREEVAGTRHLTKEANARLTLKICEGPIRHASCPISNPSLISLWRAAVSRA